MATEIGLTETRTGGVDVLIGVPAAQAPSDLAWTQTLAQEGTSILVASSGDAAHIELPRNVQFVSDPSFSAERYLESSLNIYGPLFELLKLRRAVDARVCCLWNSDPALLSTESIRRFVHPALRDRVDLVVPAYWESRLDGLVNSSIICPLTRALYGRRIRFPMAVDLAFSSAFAEHLLQSDSAPRRATQWLTAEAISSELRICQTNLEMKPPVLRESPDLSAVLSSVLGRVFSGLERNAMFWQRANGSTTIPTYGEQTAHADEEVTPDVNRMVETFQLAFRNLTEIWAVALPPATLLDLKKLSRLPAAEFQMADSLWVRIVYDFALAYRQRSINREHLLRSMTPLYLAWVASYAVQIKGRSTVHCHERLEQLALTYESLKPYLLSRWRWPDRFNP